MGGAVVREGGKNKNKRRDDGKIMVRTSEKSSGIYTVSYLPKNLLAQVYLCINIL